MEQVMLEHIKSMKPGEEIVISLEGRIYIVKAAIIEDFKGEK